MHWIRTLKSTFRRHDVLLFSEGPAYWLTFQPIIEALLARNRTFHYLTLDKSDPALQLQNNLMTARYLGGKSALSQLAVHRARIMVATTPNIGTPGFPIVRPPNVECLAHVFHSVSDVSFYRKGSLDAYDAVLMVGDFALKSIRAIEHLRGLKEKECVSVGLPYFDVLASNVVLRSHPTEPLTVLVAPSWGDKGFLPTYGDDFICDIAKAGHNVLFRPHPQSLKSEKDKMRTLQQKFANCPRIQWDTQVDGSASMAQADVLISDTSSVRFDFAFLYERPVITLDVPEEMMGDYERSALDFKWEAALERQLGPVFTIEDKDALSQKLLDAVTKSAAPQNRTRVRDAWIANFGHSGEAVADWVERKLAGTSL
jgi:hypothetical protein